MREPQLEDDWKTMADASPLTNDELAQQLMNELAAQGANLNMAGATASHAEHEGASGGARSFSGSVNEQASECDSEGDQVDDAGEAAFLEALNALRRRMNWAKVLLTIVLVCGLVSLLFIPLPWSFTLPCEIVPENRRMVTVNESAFAAKELKDEPYAVKKGDLILPFRNVFLDFNIRRYEIAADQNRAELDLLRSDTKTIGASPAVYEKLRANLLTQNEMKRRRENMVVRAEVSGIFVPSIKDVSEGRWLEKGTVLGEIVSKEVVIYTYALDREVNRIAQGDRVMIRLRGELKEYPGRIGSLNPVSVKFRDSTLVQALGGIVACYPNQKTREFTPVNVLYCITVIPDEPILCRAGRTGQAEVKKSYLMSVELVRSLMHIFYREFSF